MSIGSHQFIKWGTGAADGGPGLRSDLSGLSGYARFAITDFTLAQNLLDPLLGRVASRPAL